MLKIVRFKAVLSALILVLLFCSSCDVNKNPKPSDANTTDTAVNSSLKIVENGVCNYTIVRPDGADKDSSWVSSALDIANAIKKATGVMPAITTDWLAKGSTHDSTTKEILIGYTNYNESSQVYEELNYGDYGVSVVGSKIIVAAHSEKSIENAAKILTDAIASAATENNLILKSDDLTITKTSSKRLSDLPLYEGGSISSIYDAGENNDLVVITKTSLDEYKAYLKKLESSGFTCYTTNEIVDNHFATYTNDLYTVNAGYYDYESSSRIIIEPLAPKVGLTSDDIHSKITTPQITLIGLENPSSSDAQYQIGLSMLIRLEDGRFIIVDGGFHADHAVSLINHLKAQSPDPKNIVIAAWIITHGDGDHVGMLKGQYQKFIIEGIKVEKFIWNSPSNKALSDANITSSIDGYYSMLSAAKTFKGAEIIRAHVGQEYYLGGAKLEVLYTLESYLPKVLTAYNTTSIVINCEIAGEKFLILGDATGYALNICSRMYGSYLKADIVQLAHHGYNTGGNDIGTIDAYRIMSPELVLYPVGIKGYEENVDRAYNQALLASGNVKEVIVAGSTDHIIKLPYVYNETRDKAA